VSGIAIITEACIDVKDRAVDVGPVQSIYEFDAENNVLFSEVHAGKGEIENRHTPNRTQHPVREKEECTSCTACYQPDVCPVRRDLLRGGRPQRILQDQVQR
jgi:hypothetical protein